MSPALLVHIAGGGLAIASDACALAVRKGGPLHRGGGGVFVGSMITRASGATLLALSPPDRANLPGASRSPTLPKYSRKEASGRQRRRLKDDIPSGAILTRGADVGRKRLPASR